MKIFKQSTLLLMGLLLFAVTSCKKTDVIPATDNRLLTGDAKIASSNMGKASHFQVSAEFDYSIYNPCNGDLIDLHLIENFTGVSVFNQNRYHVEELVIYGGSGYGNNSGITYAISGNQKFIYNTSTFDGNGAFTNTRKETFSLAGSDGHTYTLTNQLKTTIDANGNYRVDIFNFSISCL